MSWKDFAYHVFIVVFRNNEWIEGPVIDIAQDAECHGDKRYEVVTLPRLNSS